MTVGIIGAGAVGSACLTALVARRCAREIVVLNRERKRAQGLATDVQYGAVLFPPVEVRDGDYDDLEGASLVMITAGINEKTGGANRNDPAGRLRLLDANVDVYKDIVPRLHAVAPRALVLVVTDPPDPLADATRRLGHDRVLSTGTYLDSLRFRFHLARRLGVSPAFVDAQILGEHGTSEVFVWSSARIAGTPILDLVGQSAQDREKFRTHRCSDNDPHRCGHIGLCARRQPAVRTAKCAAADSHRTDRHDVRRQQRQPTTAAGTRRVLGPAVGRAGRDRQCGLWLGGRRWGRRRLARGCSNWR
ncbi:MAG: NAD(P)-binding domain-containing protein [Stellaceae bacterium]